MTNSTVDDFPPCTPVAIYDKNDNVKIGVVVSTYKFDDECVVQLENGDIVTVRPADLHYH